jgi:hypothetical protein
MLLSSSMLAKLMMAGVAHPLHTLLRREPIEFHPDSEAPQHPATRQRADAALIASTLQERTLRYKRSAQSDAFRTPACHRRQGEARGSLRDIWEDTRIEAMQRLLEHGSVRIDALASAGTQPILLGALKEFDGPLDQPPAAMGVPLLDTVTAPFCAIGYLREKCVELGVPDDIPAKALSSFMNRCDFVAVWQENAQLYPLTFADGSLPTMFSILWDEISLLAKDIAVVSVFGSPLETAIQRDIQRIRVQYAQHPKLEECCDNLMNQEARIRTAIEPADL